MTNDEKQKIIQKIKRCLALSKSSNENEAATALRQAHAMMLKYDISDMDIQMDDIQEVYSESNFAKTPHAHQVMLGQLIATLFGCRIYFRKSNQRQSKIVFVGLDVYVTIAGYAFDVLIRQMTAARREYSKTQLSRVRIASNKTARADLFCQGWVLGVQEKVKMIVPPNVDAKLIELKMADKKINKVTKPKDNATGSKAITHNDYYTGLTQGRQADLHTPMHRHGEHSGLIEH